MTSIHDAPVALDTNVFIFALRQDTDFPACETLLFDKLPVLSVYMPLQILLELQHNLTGDEMRGVLRALTKAKAITWDYAPAPLPAVMQWERRGAKKGDAVVAAHLEANGIRFLVSENRHFLAEVPDLPFEVLTSEQTVWLLG